MFVALTDRKECSGDWSGIFRDGDKNELCGENNISCRHNGNKYFSPMHVDANCFMKKPDKCYIP